ncbi:hypothetical protein WAI453_001516 [Rhynchosporium graminicola]|uniref:Tryptophan dimethylallyltransferase n=1 Tax=Rhynchosporium graminicola TaxID=2792576 RepID=A0A1E1KC77_9HELO|nr:uncharacterized protein RCO7_10947 [Rhynchosporium commune]
MATSRRDTTRSPPPSSETTSQAEQKQNSNRSPSNLNTIDKPWNIINSTIKFHNADHQFWWDRTGRMLARLLEHAKYSAAEQYRELFFYALHAVPFLGASADGKNYLLHWPSPTTPDNTPIDFSWEWGLDGTGVIRYQFEAIGPNAGTELDPLNSTAADSWIQQIKDQGLVPGHDLEWYRYFKSQLLLPDVERTELTTQTIIEETTVKAGTVVAIDMEKSGPVMKICFYPGLKALELGLSNLELCARALRSLPQYSFMKGQIEPLLTYLQEATKRWNLETGILGFDLLDPNDARIKIYVRAPHTTIEYLMDAVTMGDRIDMSQYSDRVLTDLRDFWTTFLGGAPDVVPDDAPGRARPGFYYIIKAGKPVSAKLYISPVWYCKNDADVMVKLRRYFETRKQGPDMLSQMANYERALIDIFGQRTIQERCGSQYYLGCALQKENLRIVTYSSPQTFDCEQDLRKQKK